MDTTLRWHTQYFLHSVDHFVSFENKTFVGIIILVVDLWLMYLRGFMEIDECGGVE